ncbi:DUF2201 family putative metallopeptidase [Pararhizobium sp.]|uniref:DUF2201 family putative metallopeptidase n=1 Tax=Pararhizobium sp. TaxID=1977563 RepID=UPI003D115114
MATNEKMWYETAAELYAHAPWAAAVAFRFPVTADPACPTACTDGSSFRFNPEWFGSLEPESRLHTVHHEALHIMNYHVFRKPDGADHETWNIACDLAIDPLCVGVPAPGSPTLEDFKLESFKGETAERYFVLLDGLTDEKPSRPDLDQPKPSADPATVKAAIDSVYVPTSAMMMLNTQESGVNQYPKAKRAGSHNAAPCTELAELHEASTSVDWHRELAQYVQDRVRGRSMLSYKRLNKRHQHRGLNLASRARTKEFRKLLIAVDVSSSINEKLTAEAIKHTSSIVKAFSQSHIDIIHWASEVKLETMKHYTRADLPIRDWRRRGTGGTLPQQLIDYIDAQAKWRTVIVITDGEFTQPTAPKQAEIVWLLTTSDTTNVSQFGKVIVT